MNFSHAIEGFDMSIKLKKPRIKERCSQILALSMFRDILNQSQERNKMNEDSFLELMQLHNEMKNNSQEGSKFLQMDEIKYIIKDYCEQKFKDIKLQDEKIAQYLKLIAESETESENDNTKLYNTLLKMDKQIQNLIIDNKVQSAQIIEQNQKLTESLNKILDENSFLKIKLDALIGAFKAQSSQLIENIRKENAQFVTKADFISFKNSHRGDEIEILTTQSNEIIEENNLKESLDKVLVEKSQIKDDSTSILLKNEELKNDLLNVNDQLIQNNSLLQEKLDTVLDENMQLKAKSDHILSQLAPINTNTIDIFEKNIQPLSQEILPCKSKFDELPEHINSIMLFPSLLEKIKKVRVDKMIPGLHTDAILKIISYENNSKYITCSNDKTIIIRNCDDNKVIRTLNDYGKAVCDIFLLADGRLASSSEDDTIKIWNLTSGNCEQILIGHSDFVYCLLELSNSMLLSGSHDSSIGLWDISQTDKKELEFYHQVKNEKQSYATSMILISPNELAVSSHEDINIYSFNNVTNKSFKVIKTLKGHMDWVCDIKLMNNSKDFLVSCSNDKTCIMWSISQENCLKIFKGHSNEINSIQILSEKIFVSASAEVIFWNIDSAEIIMSIKPDLSGNTINSLMKNDKNELVFAGRHNFIGLIKI